MSGKRKAFRRRALLFVPLTGYLACFFFAFSLLLHTPAVYAAEPGGDEWLDHAGSNISEWRESLPFEVSGRYQIDYYGEWNRGDDLYDDEDDHRLFQYLRINVDDIVPDKVSLRFAGRLSAELDGRNDSDDFFTNIYDSFGHDANGRVYYLYLDVKDPITKDSNLKLGRMTSYEAETTLFDGAKYEQTIDKIRYYVQGGIRASQYTSADKSDAVVGAGVDYHVLPYTYVGYDFLHVEEGSLDDDYHSFDISQRFGSLKTQVRFSILNDDENELDAYGSYYHMPFDLNLTARYHALFTQLDENTNEFEALIDVGAFDVDDPDTLGVYFPFHLVNLTAYKGIGDKYGLSGGFETRWMDKNKENNDFNREYERYFISTEVSDFIWSGLTTSVTFEYWDADGSEDSFSVGIDADKRLTDKLHASGGFYYSEYRLRTVFGGGGSSEDIETPEIYGKLKYKLRENIELAAKYQVEDESDLGTTHELRLSCGIDF